MSRDPLSLLRSILCATALGVLGTPALPACSDSPAHPSGAGGASGSAGTSGNAGTAGTAGGSGRSGSGGVGNGGGGNGGAGNGGAGNGGGGNGGAGNGGGGNAGAGGAGTAGLFLGGFFPIGAFLVPPTDGHFEKWMGRGINTMVNEAGDDIVAWDRRARALGLKMIRHPLPNPADDIGRTDLLAWMQDDEPDASGRGNANLPICQQRYMDWKRVDPSRPVYINFGGSDVMDAVDSAPGCSDCLLTGMYRSFIETADWISNDRYPVAGYLNQPQRHNDLTLIGEPMDRIRGWTDKPQFCYVETSDQAFIDGARGVRPDELRAEIWLAIVHGVRGIVYFPEVVSGPNFGWDGTPAEVAAEMTIQNATITALAPVLQGEIDPPGLGATVPGPLQVAWRKAPNGSHFIVVNPVAAPTTAMVRLSGVGAAASASVFGENRAVDVAQGTLQDRFDAHAVHIYVVR